MKRKWVWFSASVVFMGGVVVIWKLLQAAGLVGSLLGAVGLRGQGKPKPSPFEKDYGSYPLSVEPLPAGDTKDWLKQMRASSGRPEQIRAQVLQETNGDGAQVVDKLMKQSQDPDTVQVLMDALRELAVQGSERGTQERAKARADHQATVEGYPIAKEEWERKDKATRGPKPQMPAPYQEPAYRFKAPQGQPGITVVASTVERIRQRVGKPEMGRFDEMLFMECLKLMAKYGSQDVPESQKVELVGGGGKGGPIDPQVKKTMRAMMADENLQGEACRVLGRLGDMETAKDIIENPHKYPGASISLFGPNAVEAYKQKRLQHLKHGGTSEAEEWISMRLTWRDRETALDLALAGDGGAGSAVMRHMVVEQMWAKDPDERMAAYLDTYMRFPETREGQKAGLAVGHDTAGLWDALSSGGYPKTRAMTLKYWEALLKQVFVEKRNFRGWDDPAFSPHYVENFLHMKMYGFYYDPKWEPFYQALVQIFKQYYPSGKVVTFPSSSNQLRKFLLESLVLAAHLGMKPANYPWKDFDVTGLKSDEKDQSWRMNLGGHDSTPEEYCAHRSLQGGCPTSLCIHLGHFRVEDLR